MEGTGQNLGEAGFKISEIEREEAKKVIDEEKGRKHTENTLG